MGSAGQQERLPLTPATHTRERGGRAAAGGLRAAALCPPALQRQRAAQLLPRTAGLQGGDPQLSALTATLRLDRRASSCASAASTILCGGQQGLAPPHAFGERTGGPRNAFVAMALWGEGPPLHREKQGRGLPMPRGQRGTLRTTHPLYGVHVTRRESQRQAGPLKSCRPTGACLSVPARDPAATAHFPARSWEIAAAPRKPCNAGCPAPPRCCHAQS